MSLSKLSPAAEVFLDQVLSARPAVAAFDCDGTLWSGDAGADFFRWELARGLVPAERVSAICARYDAYLAGQVDELSICGEMVQINEGIAEQRLQTAAREFFDEVMTSHIFVEMHELTRRLAAQGCQLWAVSSTNNWVVEAGAAKFGIPAQRCLAATLAVENGLLTSRLVRVPTDELKQKAIEAAIGRPVDVVFGNSMHDFAMLERARHPFAINPNAALEARARQLGWAIFWPDGTASALSHE